MGFFGIDRVIRDHWIYQDAEYLKVWLEMLMLARFSEDPHTELIDGDIVTVHYSQFIYGRIKWSQRLKVSEQRLRTLIAKLKKEKMIDTVLEHRKCTVYAIVNYSKFNQQSNQHSDHTQQGNTGHANQQSNRLPTSSQPAVNQQSTTKEQGSKKVKKDNKVKEEVIKTLYGTNISLTEIEYQKLCTDYGQALAIACIEYLESYKVEKSYTTKSDYLTIKRWVVEAVRKTFKEVKSGQSIQQGITTGRTEPIKGKNGILPSKYAAEFAQVQ